MRKRQVSLAILEYDFAVYVEIFVTDFDLVVSLQCPFSQVWAALLHGIYVAT